MTSAGEHEEEKTVANSSRSIDSSMKPNDPPVNLADLLYRIDKDEQTITRLKCTPLPSKRVGAPIFNSKTEKIERHESNAQSEVLQDKLRTGSADTSRVKNSNRFVPVRSL